MSPITRTDEYPTPAGQLLQWFDESHLPEYLWPVARPIRSLAEQFTDTLPPGPEMTTGLRKLLEAKDCFIRAALAKDL